ncbi:hypothetical protein [Actinacidiphila sp. bgisy160]|uniref:hypothetical protein n=1 Tax=Actinacidiphila sp. bgisy160 TaxID=3413796 RepID=UPI003D728048
MEGTTSNLPLFVERIVPTFRSCTPDIDRLRTLSDRIVLAAGHDSHGELPHRAAATLAGHIGTEPRYFPGGHIGLTTRPTEFAEHLRDTLSTRWTRPLTRSGAVRLRGGRGSCSMGGNSPRPAPGHG